MSGLSCCDEEDQGYRSLQPRLRSSRVFCARVRGETYLSLLLIFFSLFSLGMGVKKKGKIHVS